MLILHLYYTFSVLLLDRDLCFLEKKTISGEISIYYKSVKLFLTSFNSVVNVSASLLSYIHSYHYISLREFLVPTS